MRFFLVTRCNEPAGSLAAPQNTTELIFCFIQLFCREGRGETVAAESPILPGYPVSAFLSSKNGAWSKNTRQCYLRILREFSQYLDGKSEIDLALLAQWQLDLKNQGYSERSINLHISAVNNYLRWCGRYDLLMRHHQPEDTASSPELTRQEYLRMLCTARDMGRHRLYLLIKLFALTGLPLQCLDQITADAVHEGSCTVDCHGNQLDIHFPESLQKELLDYISYHAIRDGPIFITSRGQLINRSNICKEMQEVCRKAGIPEQKGNPRSLRKLYQTTKNDIAANLEQMFRRAYDQLLQVEQAAVGWKEGA